MHPRVAAHALEILETGVDLGWAGIGLLILIVAVACFNSLLKASWYPSLTAAFLTALLFEIVVRSFTETLLYRQLNYFSFIFVVCAAYMMRAPTPFPRPDFMIRKSERTFVRAPSEPALLPAAAGASSNAAG